MPVNFFNQDIIFNLKSKNNIRKGLIKIFETEEKKQGVINFIFCSDAYLSEINIKYLNHNTYTDTITFDFSENNKISGDIYISIDRIGENAKIFGVTFSAELYRVMIHGCLHLCGYEDKTKLQKLKMTSREDFYLSKIVEFQ